MPLTALDLECLGMVGEGQARGRCPYAGAPGPGAWASSPPGCWRRELSSDSIPSTVESIIYERRATGKNPVELLDSTPTSLTSAAAGSSASLSQEAPLENEYTEWGLETSSACYTSATHVSFTFLTPEARLENKYIEGGLETSSTTFTSATRVGSASPTPEARSENEYAGGGLQTPSEESWEEAPYLGASWDEAPYSSAPRGGSWEGAPYMSAPPGYFFEPSPRGLVFLAFPADDWMQGGWGSHGASAQAPQLGWRPPNHASSVCNSLALSVGGVPAAGNRHAAPWHNAPGGQDGPLVAVRSRTSRAVMAETRSVHANAARGILSRPVWSEPRQLRVAARQRKPVLTTEEVGRQSQESMPDATEAPEVADGQLDSTDDSAPKTTVMFVGLPEATTRNGLVRLLLAQGFVGKFDFVYVPCNFVTGVAHGYAFVNMVSEAFAQEVKQKLDGFTGFGVDPDRGCQVIWAKTQGRAANIEKFRNCPVMRGPWEARPAIFSSDGTQKAFPRPTRAIKKPKMSTISRSAAAHGSQAEPEA